MIIFEPSCTKLTNLNTNSKYLLKERIQIQITKYKQIFNI
jgi:hypothetical protein